MPEPRPRLRGASLQVGFLVRIFLLASMAVIGSVWALVRFYSRVRAPMVVTVPAQAEVATLDGGARVLLIPAPELELDKP